LEDNSVWNWYERSGNLTLPEGESPVPLRMILRGREQAARFSWNWTARQVLEIYQDVIGQG
jgi:hypothetical protein